MTQEKFSSFLKNIFSFRIFFLALKKHHRYAARAKGEGECKTGM
jgi:hypothetical protein